NFESNNDCKSSDYRNLAHEVECDTANVLRSALGWGLIQGHRQGAWDQPAHGEQLGGGHGAAPANGRSAPPEVDAGGDDPKIVRLSVSITVGSLTRSKPGLGLPPIRPAHRASRPPSTSETG